MADFNKKPEFQSKKADETEISREEMNKMIKSTVDYTESRCKRQFRTWLAETVMVVASISIWICLIDAFIERMAVIPTEPYRDMNRLQLVYIVVIILSVVFAQIVVCRNENE